MAHPFLADMDQMDFIDNEGDEDIATRLQTIKANLFKAIDKCSITLLHNTLKRVRFNEYTLTNRALRQDGTGYTALRYTISLIADGKHFTVDIDDTIEDLMRFQKRDLLRERYDYDKTSLETHAQWAHYAERSSLTCVHLLTAAGKVEAIKNLLRLVPQDSEDEIRELEDFLTCPVYYDIGKQYDEQPSKRLVSALHFAASVGSVEQIDILMKRGCFNADETYGEEFYRNSPLAIAVECDKVYAFRKLVELSSVFNNSSMLELVGKFLRIASATGSRDIVKELLRLAKKDNHINTLKFQDLIQACKLHATSRGFKQVETLLGEALNPDYGLRDALREAVKVGKKDTVEELVAKGAQVDEVPLMECVINEKSELLPSLLPRASKVPQEFWMGVATAKEDFAKLAFDNYERTRSDDEKLDFTNNQVSPIHVAAAQDRVEMVTSFCNLGASLHNVDERGNLIVHVAAKHDAVNVLKEKLQFFDVNALNADGDTILLVACKRSRPKTVELLTDTPGVNWKVKNTFGDTPLHVAVKQLFVTGKAIKRRRDKDNDEVTMATREEKIQTIALVAAKCADISALDEVDSEGNTALSLLVQAGREQLFHLFSKADPTVLNAKRKCAMDYAMAAFEERRDLVRKLLEIFPAKGAAHLAMAYKHGGRPPLHHFAMSRDLSNVRLLTQHCADVTELNEEGCPIFHALIKLSVQDDNYAGEYIAMAQTVMEALTEFRIKRQQDICCYMSGEYAVSNSNGVEGYESESFGKSLDSSLTALLVKKKSNDVDNDYLGLEGNKFISNKQLKPYDIKRILFVYLTRILKSREGFTALNYAIKIKAKSFVKYLLEIREKVERVTIASQDRNRSPSTASQRPNSEFILPETEEEMTIDEVMAKTMLVLYDATCLTPESTQVVSLQDCEWIEAALREDYLRDLFFRVSNGTLSVKGLYENSMFRQWSIAESFAAWTRRNSTLITKQSSMSVARSTSKFSLAKKKIAKPEKEPSALEMVVDMADEVTAADFLNLTPLSQLVESYWSIYRWLYFIIMQVHIFFMILFSSFSIPTALLIISNTTETTVSPNYICTSPDSSVENSNVTEIPTSHPSYKLYALFLIYPLVFLIVTVYFEVLSFTGYIRKRRLEERQKAKKKFTITSAFAGVLDWPYKATGFFLECLPTFGCISFAVCMCAWYVLLLREECNRNYCLSVCLLVGWLLTINYTRGFQSLHSFKNIMKSIVMSDMLRFFMVYIFIFIGFTLGFHVLLPLVVVDEIPSAFDSFFLNLRNFLNPIDILELEYFKQFSYFSLVGGTYVRIAYLIFSFMMGLILINILIAMMNDSYITVNRNEQITFRLGSLRQAMTIFRAFPIILRQKERIMRGDESQMSKSLFSAYHTMNLQLFNLCCEVKIVEDQEPPTVDERLDNIERQVKAVSSEIDNLFKKIDAINEAREDTRAVLSAMMAKLDECTTSVKSLATIKADVVSAISAGAPNNNDRA